MFERFGADVQSGATSERLAEISQLDAALLDWRGHWLDTMAVDAGGQGCQANALYYHEARLNLHSHVFRGSRMNEAAPESSTAGSVHAAFDSAIAVIRILGDQVGGDQRLVHLPSYHETMLAYASVYLLKTTTSELPADAFVKEECIRLLRTLARRLHIVTFPTDCSRPLLRLKNSLASVLSNMTQSPAPQTAIGSTDSTFDPTLLSDDFWNMNYTGTLSGDDWLHSFDH